MNSRKVIILAVVAVAVLGAALLLSYERSSPQQETADALYPDLKAQLDAIRTVRIFKAGDEKVVELARKDSQWVVSERSGYPADGAKVRKLLLSLADARPVEEKTSNPQNYPTLGVEDVKDSAATGTRVELEGPAAPVNLIVGKAAGAKGAYVRRAGEPASWLIDQSIDAPGTAGEWLRTSVIDVTADRVQSATVSTDGAKPYTAEKASRADADFKVSSLPKGKEVDTFAVNGVAGALAGLTLSDVRPASEFQADKPTAHATFRTFDGLVVELDGWNKDDKHYIAAKTAYDAELAKRFHVETKAPEKAVDAKPEENSAAAPVAQTKTDDVAEAAKTTNERLQGWVYQIADYKYEAIFKPASALTKK